MFIRRWLFYNIVLVSSMYQHESAIDICMPPSSWTSLPPPTLFHPSRLSQSTGFELSASHSTFSLAICFTCGNVYVSKLLSQFVPSCLPLAGSTSLFSMFVSPLLLCRQVHHYHLSRFHIYALIYNICLSLTCFTL